MVSYLRNCKKLHFYFQPFNSKIRKALAHFLHILYTACPTSYTHNYSRCSSAISLMEVVLLIYNNQYRYYSIE